MPRRTYGTGRQRPQTNDGLVARLAEQFTRASRPPEWQERREIERANRVRNRPVIER